MKKGLVNALPEKRSPILLSLEKSDTKSNVSLVRFNVNQVAFVILWVLARKFEC
ncbi:hypothetical protein VCRA2122O339_610003 [Vibrio crassostreae]|nr:hypothetical protein VCRA2120E331_600002 [Vibrio crassostreae]CAK3566147.1 hypothetical protein VCRA2120E330_590001 [Vibrio crassostreae]CAK3581331.1 hypothetical protein VCRA2127O345_600001 [Vibrio crassostreae]CAK3594924.1 hypothetical protein VCRA2122O338_570003 [Vibrio crassostreae]CAK3618544.1 hypothetical protein VCRA2122O339_610003 [Vibrio crassostreae]